MAAIVGGAVTGVHVLAQAPAGPQPQAAPTARPQPGTVVGTPAQDTVKGAALLAEARKALGGEDKFKAVQRLEVKGKSARAQQQQNVEGDFEYLLEFPDKFRRKESINLGNAAVDITQLLNGAEVFEEAAFDTAGGIGGFDGGDGGGGGRGGGRGGRGGRGNIAGLLGGTNVDPNADPETQKEAQRKNIASEMARYGIAWLLTTTEPIAWIGVAESPDGKADVLEFKTPDGVPTRLLLDSATHMPLMMTWTGTTATFGNFNRGGRGGNAPGGGPQGDAQGRRGGRVAQQASLQMHLSDYKTVSGIKLPHLIQSGANGETTEELVVKSYKINPSFKAETFKK